MKSKGKLIVSFLPHFFLFEIHFISFKSIRSIFCLCLTEYVDNFTWHFSLSGCAMIVKECFVSCEN